MRDDYRRTIILLANHNMNAAAVARALPAHYNTVKQRIKRIKETTGLDPQNFHDLVKLYAKAMSKEEV